MREDGRIRFAREIRDRVDGLRDAVRSVKGELLGRSTVERFALVSWLTVFPQTASRTYSQPSSIHRMFAIFQRITRPS